MPTVRYNAIRVVANVAFGFVLNNASRSLCIWIQTLDAGTGGSWS